MDYEEGQPIPEGYHVESRARKGLVIGGAVTFGALYLLTVLTGALIQSIDSIDGGSGDEWTPMYVPLAGPFVTAGAANSEGGGTALLMLLGIGQVSGAAMLVGGLAAQSTELVRNDAARLSVRPLVGNGTLGVGLSGSL
jgi:hypothetical protein